METLRVLPTHPSQGEWVVINAADFDPARHVLWSAPEPGPVPAPKKGKKPPVAAAASEGPQG
jgi:hypothetical protein